MKIQQDNRRNAASTAERLLDAAEELFAEHGYSGVGMRALAEKAGVNLGAATYHYASKENLYTEAFMRRFQAVGKERMELLRQAEAASSGPLPVEIIVDCLLRPAVSCTLQYPHMTKLFARNLFLPPPFMKAQLHNELSLQLAPFIEAFAKALPELPPELLRMRLMLAGGSLLMFVRQLSKMLPCELQLIEFALQELVEVVSLGMKKKVCASALQAMTLPFFETLRL